MYFSTRKHEVTHHAKFAAAAVEVSLYEARHACALLAASNPSLLDALRSPLVYRDCGGWLARARDLADAHYSPRELGTAWSHGAASNVRCTAPTAYRLPPLLVHYAPGLQGHYPLY